MSLAAANRYARALADVIAEKRDQAEYRQVMDELEAFAAVYGESAELREVFSTPALSLDHKTKVLKAVTTRLGTSRISTNFLRVLLAHYRMALLPDVRQAFQRIANQRLGVVRVKVVSATHLSESEQEALRARFSELTGKRVEMQYATNPDLLGGVRAQIESTVYDGSIRGQFARIRQHLAAE